MSKNIVIQEGGVGRQFTANKLTTALVGGGSCNWVPEDEVGLTTLSVTENGTYSASDEGKYGYSQVNVSVPGGAGGPPGGTGSSIIGVDPTTGNENLVTVDEDGNIETVELPSYIVVDTPPTKVIYDDGDLIDFTGMVVKAYKKSGELWENEQYPHGIIPINDLQCPVKTADIDAAISSWERDVTGTDLVSPVYLVPLNVGDIFGNLPIMSIEGGPVYGMCTPGAHFVVVSLVESTVITARIDGSYPETYNVTRPYTYNERTCYCSQESQRPHGENDIPLSAPQRHTIEKAAAIALLGTTSMEGIQEIPIQYTRSDGDVLESSFNITVNEASGGGGGDT